MYLHMYIYAYVYMYVCIYIYIYIYKYVPVEAEFLVDHLGGVILLVRILDRRVCQPLDPARASTNFRDKCGANLVT